MEKPNTVEMEESGELFTTAEGEDDTPEGAPVDDGPDDELDEVLDDAPGHPSQSGGDDADDSSDPVDLPQALKRLRQGGVSFEPAPKYDLTCHGVKTTISKNFSVYFTVDTVVTSQDIIYGFDKADIDIDAIVSIQRKGSNRSWVVTFSSAEAKEKALSVPSVTVAQCQVFIGDTENRTVLVKIYECPDEMPDTFVISRLSKYGSVLSFRRDMLADGIRNGIRTARMQLILPIPSSLSIAGELVFINYPGQPRTCRRCGDQGHEATTCRVVRCFNCWVAGHRVEECTAPEHCQICDETNHRTPQCLFFVYSANVTPSTPGITSYGSAAKTIASAEQANVQQKSGKESGKLQDSRTESKGKDSRTESKGKDSHARKEKDLEDERERDRHRDHRDHGHDRDDDKGRPRDDDKGKPRDHKDDHRSYSRRERDRDYHRSRNRDRSSYSDRNDIEEFSTDDEGWATVRYKRKYHNR